MKNNNFYTRPFLLLAFFLSLCVSNTHAYWELPGYGDFPTTGELCSHYYSVTASYSSGGYYKPYTNINPYENTNEVWCRWLHQSPWRVRAKVVGNWVEGCSLFPDTLSMTESVNNNGNSVTAKACVPISDLETQGTDYTYYDVAPKIGLLKTIDGPRVDVSDVTTLDYDTQGNLALVTNALGHSSQIIAHDPSGRPLEMVSSNDLHTTFQYDVRGRLEQSSSLLNGETAANARTTVYTYTPAGDINSIALPSGETLTYTYDDARRLTQVTDRLGNYISYGLDLMGNITSETVHASDTSIVQTQTAVYNQLGQLFQTIGAENQITEYGYDANGNNSGIIDARTNPTTSAFDALNRLKSVLDAKSGTTYYGYDVGGNLNSVTDPNGHTTTYTYDFLGNLTSLISPDTGLTAYDSYDEAGNVLQETNANGITITYSYDALNRLTQIQYPDSNQNITYHYDGSNYTAGDQPPSSHKPIGQRTGMTDATGSISWFYNAHGELIQTSQTLASGSTFITRHTYQPQTGLMASTTYPNESRLDYFYDTQGEVSQIDLTNYGQIQTLISNVQYQPFGGVQSLDYGNGLNLSRSYDLDGRLTTLQVSGINTVLDLSWTYNPVSSVDGINNLLEPLLSQSFDYDALDRLSIAQTDASLYGLLGFAYDANGNRTQQDDNSQLTDYLISTSSNRTDSASGAQVQEFQYDAKGNITQHTFNGNSFDYLYDQRNRLQEIIKNSVSLATYQYNGLGQRVSKTLADGTQFYYLYNSYGQLVSELDAFGNNLRQYFYFDGKPLAVFVAGQELFYYHNDHLGTPQLLTYANQDVVWQGHYSPFGQVTPLVELVENNLRFAGQYYDAESGLHYNYFRYYDPSLGRYITSDPIGLGGGLNTYSYVYQNPLKWTDEMGLEVTYVCRPLAASASSASALPYGKHCGTIVWHRDECGNIVIDDQFSLDGGGRSFVDPSNPSQTFKDDRNAFLNPGPQDQHFLIPPPPGKSQDDFDLDVRFAGHNYSQGRYNLTGPNSNTAANNAIQNAGGNVPKVPGAVGQQWKRIQNNTTPKMNGFF